MDGNTDVSAVVVVIGPIVTCGSTVVVFGLDIFGVGCASLMAVFAAIGFVNDTASLGVTFGI